MKFAIGHVRVSSNKQFDHGDSIEAQKQRIEEAAARRDFTIVRWFVEHYSGRKDQRMVIDDMLVYLANNQDDVRAVFIYQINRFTRAGGDNYLYLRKQLYDLDTELIDTHGIIQKSQNSLAHLGFSYEWSNQSPSRLAEVMVAENAYSGGRDILTRTIGQQIRLTKKGYQCRPANIGYKNVKIMNEDGKKRPIMVPDEIESPWFKTMFELRADGQFSDQEICNRVNAMGYKSRRYIRRDPKTRKVIGTTGELPLIPKKLDEYITHTIYCGVRVEKWTNYEPIKTPFPGLVSIDLFNRANRGKVYIYENKNGSLVVEYNKRKHRRSPDNPDFLLRHVVNCPHCQSPFMGSFSTNKFGKPFGYYHCARKHKRLAVAKPVFESTVGKYLEQIEFKPVFLGLFKETIREVWQEKNKSAQVEVQAATDHVDGLRARQDMLMEKIEQLNSPVVIRKLENEVDELEVLIKKASQHKDKFEVKIDQIEAYFEFAKNLLEHPYDCSQNAPARVKLEKVWGFIFKSTPTYEELKSGTPRLSLLYRLAQASDLSKKELAYQARKNWNFFEEDIQRFLFGTS